MPSEMAQRAQLGPWVVEGRRYVRSLPPELEAAYIYVSDGGHSLIVLIDELVEGDNVDDYLLPVPVRLVLALGYRVDDRGYVHVRMGEGMSYDSRIGLTLPEGYDEW